MYLLTAPPTHVKLGGPHRSGHTTIGARSLNALLHVPPPAKYSHWAASLIVCGDSSLIRLKAVIPKHQSACDTF